MAHRVMVFVDGENIVCRYQAMLAKGAVPQSGVVHIPNVMVWRSETTHPVMNSQILRVTYYTYTTGNEEKIADLRTQFRRQGFDCYTPRVTSGLTPMIFWKSQQSAKAKGVDIQMTVDILTHVHQNNVDAVHLVTGDGDYIPLVQEVLRSGKQVYISAFSNGLNPNLAYLADGFESLDNIYFSSIPEHT